MPLSSARPLAIHVQGVKKAFGTDAARVEALRGVDLEVPQGEFVAVMGPSGSGKSTLLHVVAGLDMPTSGTVKIGGDELTTMTDDQLTLVRRRKIGFVFQAFNLLDVLTSEENVAIPLLIDGIDEKQAHARAIAAMESVGIAHRRTHRPSELSGGEQQRVAIARALVTEPLLLLADEPTGNLDSANSDQVMKLMRDLVDERGQTIFMVTHNPEHARLVDRLVLLRDGHIEEIRVMSERAKANETAGVRG